jgi:hypothetical protein
VEKKDAPQTHAEMAADWAEANPHLGYRRSQFFHPNVIRRLGFAVDRDGYVHLPGHVDAWPDRGKKSMTVSQGSSTRNYFVVVLLKKAQQFDNAAAELMSIANQPCELYDDGDSGVFRFGFETKSEAEGLQLELEHFPKKYGSIVMLHGLPGGPGL